MADTAAPAAPPPPPSATDAPAAAPAAPSAAASVPDWVPSQFAGDFGSDGYAEKVSRGFADAHAKLSTRQDDLRKQVAADFETERRKGLPEKPDGYQFAVEDESAEWAKLLAEHKVKFVDELPEKHEGPETLYALNKDGDATGWWRDMCHRLGLPVDVYREGIARIVVRDIRKVTEGREANAKRYAAEDAAEAAKLGPNAAERKKAADAGIAAMAEKLLGAEKGKLAAGHMATALLGAEGVEFVEKLIQITSGGLRPGVGGVAQELPNPFQKTMSQLTGQRSA